MLPCLVGLCALSLTGVSQCFLMAEGDWKVIISFIIVDTAIMDNITMGERIQ
ncbi:exported hypothetical protein [Xenorhabdus szentirmaii DSM 16338]|uniref:Uncharacterized protein n=1 Tax=Xenorhabdus szentirmaii DSM 16338 TaxID=1427518 RepID=W1J001_9GAMM|nr:exported hypothetical protein [Xenorhabdus szentirmaii DSM 16338]